MTVTFDVGEMKRVSNTVHVCLAESCSCARFVSIMTQK